MIDLQRQRLSLATGVELDVWTAGSDDAPAMIFLHGFPESHRAWRFQMEAFAADHRVVAPDQRGFARSSKPAGPGQYSVASRVADVLALADALGIDSFTLVGHDWGGIIAWFAAAQYPRRIPALVIVNAPHPTIFQRTLFDDPGQRAASQYITAFRSPDFVETVTAGGLHGFFDAIFRNVDPAPSAAERQAYIDEWSQPGSFAAMLDWYRGYDLVVPAIGDEDVQRPVVEPMPVAVPTLVVWGMRDTALLPVQLEGLEQLVVDLAISRLPAAGHFAPWEAPAAVNAAIRGWLDARKAR